MTDHDSPTKLVMMIVSDPDADDLMATLVENALNHFAHEEQLFARFGYPDLAAHSSTHDRIATEMIGLKQTFKDTDFSRKLMLQSSIDIESFVPADEIDRLYWETPYHLLPDGKTGIEAFAVHRDGQQA